jgi:DNA polymerase I-like protein with 3'-5' exonuclease and polymerase domains
VSIKQLLESCPPDKDPYRLVAAHLFDVKYEDVTEEQRERVKRLVVRT